MSQNKTFSSLFYNKKGLIWLLVCRSQRLQKTDTELKEHEAVNYHFKEAKQFDLGQRLKYLFFGNMDVISPSASPLLKPKQTVRISAKTEKSKADHVQTVNEKSPKKLTKKPAKK